MTKVLPHAALPLLLFLSACGPGLDTAPAASTPVPTASETAVTPSLTPLLPAVLPSETPTLLPSLTPSSTATPSGPTLVPTLTETAIPLPSLAPPTQLATGVPPPAADSGAIQILNPGPLSKIVSPLEMRGYAIPGFNNRARFELYGEDGRLLARSLVILPGGLKWAYYYQKLPFDVSAAGELGRISVSTQDADGRTTALYSIHVLLLSEGATQITPPGSQKERVVLDSPEADDFLSGGVLHVAGKMRPFNKLAVVVELVTPDGGALSTRLVSVPPAADDGYVPFSVDLTYGVRGSTSALLVVRQADDRIPGAMYLFSMPVMLHP